MDTTRAYAAAKLQESNEFYSIARRHALYCAESLEIGTGGATLFPDLSVHSVEVGNIQRRSNGAFPARATLLSAWRSPLAPPRQSYAFRCSTSVGVGAGVRWPRWIRSIKGPAGNWLSRKLWRSRPIIGRAARRGPRSLAGWNSPNRLEKHEFQLRLLSGLNVFLTKLADFDGALAAAQRFAAIAMRSRNPANIRGAEWMLGAAHHLLGNQPLAQLHFEQGFDAVPSPDPLQVGYFGHDRRSRAFAGLARTLWLRGMPERAFALARQAIEVVDQGAQPVAFCVCLLYVIPIFLRSGDFTNAEKLIERLIAVGEQYSLQAYQADGLALKGELMIARGETDKGILLLRQALPSLLAVEHNVMVILATRALAEGLLRCGQISASPGDHQCRDRAFGERSDLRHCRSAANPG